MAGLEDFFHRVGDQSGPQAPIGVEAQLKMADDMDLKAVTRQHAEAILASLEATLPAGPKPGAAVMGHTHELDAGPNYLNLGTWIDHVSGLAEADPAKADRTLPVLVVEDENTPLHDSQKMVGAVTDCRVLWRRGIGCI